MGWNGMKDERWNWKCEVGEMRMEMGCVVVWNGILSGLRWYMKTWEMG